MLPKGTLIFSWTACLAVLDVPCFQNASRKIKCAVYGLTGITCNGKIKIEILILLKHKKIILSLYTNPCSSDNIFFAEKACHWLYVHFKQPDFSLSYSIQISLSKNTAHGTLRNMHLFHSISIGWALCLRC